MNIFTRKFISSGFGVSEFNAFVNAPCLRHKFDLEKAPDTASLKITGIGFYRLFVNGNEITRGHLSPYIADPDHYVYFDGYDLAPYLTAGENVIGIILGAGLRNCVAGNWGFQESLNRGEPMCALVCDITTDGEKVTFEADCGFVAHKSPIIMNDIRLGEFYDARLEADIEGWTLPGFDDSSWTPVRRADPPRGEHRMTEVQPIKVRKTLSPVKIWPEDDAFIFDFGQNGAGLLNIHTFAEAGREISVEFADLVKDGRFYNDCISYITVNTESGRSGQLLRYTAKGGEQHYKASFTYEGFRYVKVHGITAEEAKPELLTFDLMCSSVRERGNFTSSDEVLNTLQRITREASYSNLFHVITDCPQREKNGWTADVAVSSVHMLLNLETEDVLREWHRTACAMMNRDGVMPGLVPTATGQFYEWWNGPAWDAALTELPYRLLELRSDSRAARTAFPVLFRYIAYTLTRRDPKGLVHIGLGDWVAPHDPIKAPLELTDTITCYDICRKSALIYDSLGAPELVRFCLDAARGYRDAVRLHLIDHENCIAAGNCQTSQAMAIYYGMFTEEEKPLAVKQLVKMIEDNDWHHDCGVLGIRVLFRVLTEAGHVDVAHRVMVQPTAPSYGEMVARGETTLVEDFNSADQRINSRNHHFLGDISAWFIDSICGIKVNPEMEVALRGVVDSGKVSYYRGATRVDVRPALPQCMDFAEAYHEMPSGKVTVRLERVREDWIRVTTNIEGDIDGQLYAPMGYKFDGSGEMLLGNHVVDAFKIKK